MFSKGNNDTPLRSRLRRKQNRILLCKYSEFYFQRWARIFWYALITTIIVWAFYPKSILSWLLTASVLCVIAILYILLEIVELNPKEEIAILQKQLEGHDLSD